MIAAKYHKGESDGPAGWPAEIAHNVSTLPDSYDALFADRPALDAYLATMAAAKDAWLLARPAAEAEAATERTQAKAVRAALLAGTGTAGERIARCERVLAYLIRHVLG